jgi:hypothetical protein
MSVRLDGEIIRLEGRCHVEDAEPLLGLLQAATGRVVDVSDAETLHTAVIQVILAFRPGITGESRDGFIRRWIAPALAGVSGSTFRR